MSCRNKSTDRRDRSVQAHCVVSTSRRVCPPFGTLRARCRRVFSLLVDVSNTATIYRACEIDHAKMLCN